MRQIKNNSTFEPYNCICDWPDDCFVQGGGDGIVIVRNGDNYNTAYFEAFPKNPDCFIRGEGETMEDAEKDAYEQFLRFSKCEHTFIRTKGYHNGMGTCTKCGMMKTVFKPDYHCVCCDDNEAMAYTSILPKYHKNENDTICKSCATKKENFKYLSGFEISHLCSYKNGIPLIYPIMDKKTFDELKEKPETKEAFFEIVDKDSNIYLGEHFRRMLLDKDEVELKYSSMVRKVQNYDELYEYVYNNHIKKWLNREFRVKKKEREE